MVFCVLTFVSTTYATNGKTFYSSTAVDQFKQKNPFNNSCQVTTLDKLTSLSCLYNSIIGRSRIFTIFSNTKYKTLIPLNY